MSKALTRRQAKHKDFWINHIEQWQQSGLSKVEYCRQHNLNASNFYNLCSSDYQANKLAVQKTSPLKLLSVGLSGGALNQPNTITLKHASGQLSFPSELPAEQVAYWLGIITQLQADD